MKKKIVNLLNKFKNRLKRGSQRFVKRYNENYNMRIVKIIVDGKLIGYYGKIIPKSAEEIINQS